MNKLVKNALITATSVLLGLFITAATICLHASDDKGNFNQACSTYNGFYEDLQAADSQSINAIDISFGSGRLTIEETDASYIGIKSENAEEFQYYTEQGTFVLKMVDKSNTSLSNKLTLYLPKGYCPQDLSIELGAGVISAGTLNADFMDLSIGAGQLDITNGTVKNCNLELSMGAISYKGIITGNLDGKCSTGNLSLILADKQTDHNYYLDCSMGDMNVGDLSYKGINFDKYIDNGATSDYHLECSMSSIFVTFTE